MFFLGRIKFLGNWSDEVIRWGDICMVTVGDDQCEKENACEGPLTGSLPTSLREVLSRPCPVPDLRRCQGVLEVQRPEQPKMGYGGVVWALQRESRWGWTWLRWKKPKITINAFR